VGISIDGPAQLHNRHRSYPSGTASYDDVIRGLDLLKEYEVDISALAVVDDATLKLGAKRLLEFLIAAGISSFGLLAANTPKLRSLLQVPTLYMTLSLQGSACC
jgi:uncharacterized protein